MVRQFAEWSVEEAALEWFEALGYVVLRGPQVAPGEPAAEREADTEVVLRGRLRDAIARLNPTAPVQPQEEALRKLLRRESPSLVAASSASTTILRISRSRRFRRCCNRPSYCRRRGLPRQG